MATGISLRVRHCNAPLSYLRRGRWQHDDPRLVTLPRPITVSRATF